MNPSHSVPPGARIAVVLRAHREELIRLWERRVLNDPRVPEANRLSKPELHDHIPKLIDELACALEEPDAGEAAGRRLGWNEAAVEHARQRRERGYSVAAAQGELSHFRIALIELCAVLGVRLDGEVAKLVHAAIDQNLITDADEMEQATREEHRKNIAFRERFIGILGHDLRTPLTTIMVALAAVGKGGGLSEMQERVIGRAIANTQRMERLIGDLLDVTRARLGGHIPISPQPVDLCAIARSVVEEQQSARPDRIVLVEAPEPLRGVWDPDRLVQVLANLIGNALDYSLPDTPVRVTLHRSGTEAILAVHNQGPTIPAEVIPHIFDPFHQGPQSGRTSKRSSFGLGLFITEQIVTAHGGSIDVTSTEDAGTTFRVRLPGAASTE